MSPHWACQGELERHRRIFFEVVGEKSWVAARAPVEPSDANKAVCRHSGTAGCMGVSCRFMHRAEAFPPGVSERPSFFGCPLSASDRFGNGESWDELVCALVLVFESFR